jgi:hypothetical protein
MKRRSFSGADGPESKNAMFSQPSWASVLTACADYTYNEKVETINVLLVVYSVDVHSFT